MQLYKFEKLSQFLLDNKLYREEIMTEKNRMYQSCIL